MRLTSGYASIWCILLHQLQPKDLMAPITRGMPNDQYWHNFSFPSHQLLFLHASAEVRGKNTPDRKVTSTGDQTHKHQVMSLTCSPLSHPGGMKAFVHNKINPFPNKPWFLRVCSTSLLKTQWEKEKLLVTSNFSFSLSVFCRLGKLSAIFIKFEFVLCKLFQFGRV